MLRVVVDPNVLISAAIAGGNPQRLVELATFGVIRLVGCPLLFDELETVLGRDRFLRWRTREQLTRFVLDVRALAETAPDPESVPPVTRDPNDDYLVALVHSSRADGLCSGDADLRALEGVSVWTPAELVRRLLDET